MHDPDGARDQITDYERAVCYFSLPRMVHPLTYGLIAAYTLCLVEAGAAMAIGYLLPNRTWFLAGLYSFIGLLIFGMAAFFLRSLMNEVRKRRLLAEARAVPAAQEAPAGAYDIPDPFARHLLIKRPLHPEAEIFACTHDDGTVYMLVERRPGSDWWRLKTPQDELICEGRAISWRSLFSYGASYPARVRVNEGEAELGQIVRYDNPVRRRVEIACQRPRPRKYIVRDGSIFLGDHCVGRIYSLRRWVYLDVDKGHSTEPLLLYFATQTEPT